MTHSDEADRPAWFFAATPAAVSQWLSRLWWATVIVDLSVVVASFFLSPSVFPPRRASPRPPAKAAGSAELAM